MILPGPLDVSGRSRRNAYRAMRELRRHRTELDEAVRALDVAPYPDGPPRERAVDLRAPVQRSRA